MYKTLVVYYSMGGNTDYVAHQIAEKTGAELLRLEPVTAYPDKGLKKFLWGGKSALMSEHPQLKPYAFDVNEYDRIVFGFPVWAGTVAPPVRTFLSDHFSSLRSRQFFAFACQSGAGGEKAIERVRQMLCLNAFRATMVLNDPKDKPSEENEQKIRAFCDALTAGKDTHESAD
ncbi:MAG: NAD(P)H-dependent oxidoreductase [Lachnospiraceae bacterium]|nr:NAD(P)H-dependent oxidoreductase [Lachnospiraceae bacterium]